MPFQDFNTDSSITCEQFGSVLRSKENSIQKYFTMPSDVCSIEFSLHIAKSQSDEITTVHVNGEACHVNQTALPPSCDSSELGSLDVFELTFFGVFEDETLLVAVNNVAGLIKFEADLTCESLPTFGITAESFSDGWSQTPGTCGNIVSIHGTSLKKR